MFVGPTVKGSQKLIQEEEKLTIKLEEKVRKLLKLNKRKRASIGESLKHAIFDFNLILINFKIL